jgi:peptide deformylase
MVPSLWFNLIFLKDTMSKLLQISQLGHPILRKAALKVTNIKNKGLQNLIDDLLATLKDADGVGIAAPQVYESKRLFIIASKPSKRHPNVPRMKPMAVINPTILENSDKMAKDWEGCLSIPGIRALVPRYNSVKIEYTTRNGKKVSRKFKDFIARIFQHEYDHLEGIIFLDRIETVKDIITEKEYQKIVNKKSK